MIEPREVTNGDDVIDSRDVIERISFLEGKDDRDESDDDELETLKNLADEAQGYCADWEYGETLIRDSYFKEYAEQFAEEIGAIDSNATWPNNCIDWDRAARELQQDYTSIDFDGVEYWTR